MNKLNLNSQSSIMKLILNIKFYLPFLILIFKSYSVISQNTSYDANTIPINSGNAEGPDQNCAFGFKSLFSLTNGKKNVALGYNSMLNNSTGTLNTACGYSSLFNNTIGKVNIAIGNNSLYNNTIGNENTSIGSNSMFNNLSGRRNIALGSVSLYNNTTGVDNIAIGFRSLYSQISGKANSAFGNGTLIQNINGTSNTAIGGRSLANNISGSENTALGARADVSYPDLVNATAIGSNSKVEASNTIQLGDANVTKIIAGVNTNAKLIVGGLQVLGGNLTAGNVLTSDGFGNGIWQAPSGGGGATNGWLTTGNVGTVDGVNFIGNIDNVPLNFRTNNKTVGKITENSILFGLNAGGLSPNNSLQNIGIGRSSLFNNLNSNNNVAIGDLSLYSLQNGFANTAVGISTLFSSTNGSYNTALGANSLLSSNGNFNTAVGNISQENNDNGNENSSLGNFSLSNNVFGNDNIAIGANSNTTLGNLSNSGAVGAYTLVNLSDKIRIGATTVTQVEGPVMYTFSDRRFKNNISETDVKGLEFIKKLRPVVYNLDTKAVESFLTQNMPDSVSSKYMNKDFTKSTAIRQSGFIAQEVETAANEVGYNFNGVHIPETKEDNYSLAYAEFVVPLVKAVQELSTQNNMLRNELDQMKLAIKEIAKSNTENSLKGEIKITEGKDENSAQLFQNTPNPFSQNTVIKYSIPNSAKNAKLTINTIGGKQIKIYDLKNTSITSLEINGGQLSAGSYIYSLIVDNVLIDSKQMILTKN